jgi:protein TonB
MLLPILWILIALIQVPAEEQSWKLIYRVDPVCPALGSQLRIHGTVKFTAIIDKEGHISDLRLISGHPLLVKAATDAVRQWLYRPTLVKGEPVEVITPISVYLDCTLEKKSRPHHSAAAIGWR